MLKLRRAPIRFRHPLNQRQFAPDKPKHSAMVYPDRTRIKRRIRHVEVIILRQSEIRVCHILHKLSVRIYAVPPVRNDNALEAVRHHHSHVQRFFQHIFLTVNDHDTRRAAEKPAPTQTVKQRFLYVRLALHCFIVAQSLRRNRTFYREPVLCHVFRD